MNLSEERESGGRGEVMNELLCQVVNLYYTLIHYKF